MSFETELNQKRFDQFPLNILAKISMLLSMQSYLPFCLVKISLKSISYTKGTNTGLSLLGEDTQSLSQGKKISASKLSW